MKRNKVRIIILLGAAVAAPFVAGRFIGIWWGAMLVGALILAAVLGLAHLWGKVESALRKGGEG